MTTIRKPVTLEMPANEMILLASLLKGIERALLKGHIEDPASTGATMAGAALAGDVKDKIMRALRDQLTLEEIKHLTND